MAPNGIEEIIITKAVGVSFRLNDQMNFSVKRDVVQLFSVK
jgi:hypothetical protein